MKRHTKDWGDFAQRRSFVWYNLPREPGKISFQAKLDGIVYCPFCDFAAILEDPTDKIFECQSCSVASCRYCRVKSHHPMSCESSIILQMSVLMSRISKREENRCQACC